MDILYLLDRLETVLTSGSRIPLTGKTVVDEHECLDIIDQLRVAVPEEVKQAKRMHSDRDRIIQEAEERASRIVAHAQEQASNLAEQHEIAKVAEAAARRILAEADAEAAERKDGADRYAAETLAELEHRLDELTSVVRNGLRSLDHEPPVGSSQRVVVGYDDEEGRPI
jgi:regulator of protease activity HflC (stomatin/prohibitin superfamily)